MTVAAAARLRDWPAFLAAAARSRSMLETQAGHKQPIALPTRPSRKTHRTCLIPWCCGSIVKEKVASVPSSQPAVDISPDFSRPFVRNPG